MEKLSFVNNVSPRNEYIKVVNIFLDLFGYTLKRSNEDMVKIIKNSSKLTINEFEIDDIFSPGITTVQLDNSRKIEFMGGLWIDFCDKNKGRFHIPFKYGYEPLTDQELKIFLLNHYFSKYVVRKCVIEEFEIKREAPDKDWTEWMAFVLDYDKIKYSKETNSITFESNHGSWNTQSVKISDNLDGIYTTTLEKISGDKENNRIDFVYKVPKPKSDGLYRITYNQKKPEYKKTLEKGYFDGDYSSMIINDKLVRNCIKDVLRVFKRYVPKFTLPEEVLSQYPFILPFEEITNKGEKGLKYFEMLGEKQVFKSAEKAQQRIRNKIIK